jgi:hypothetical protein
MRLGLGFRTIVGILLAVVLIFLWEKLKSFSVFSKAELKTTQHTVLQKISNLGKMELVKYQFKDIVEQEIVQQLLPNPKALLIIEGEAVGCIDMKNIKPENIQILKDTLLLTLPQPEICYFKINHERSKVYETSFAFMNEGLLLEEAFKKAEKQIEKAALETGILEKTKQNARQILGPMLSQIAEKNVKIIF